MLAFMNTVDKFAWVDWIVAERKKKGWSQATLALHSDLSRTAISDYEKRKRVHPDVDALSKIANALGYPPEQVLRIANKLPPEPKDDPLVKLITYLSEQLPTDEDKKDAAEYIRMRLRLAEERGHYGINQKQRPTKT
jgi:transcriptional regulator with XRE-family HTH domain